MLETKTHFQIEKDGKRFTFICDPNSSLGVIHDVLDEMKGFVIDKMISASKTEEQQEEVSNDDKQTEC